MKRRLQWIAAIVLLGFLMVTLAASLSRSEGQAATAAAVGYAILVTLFLLAQVWGFVLSQVSYVETVEDVKFQVLEKEGIFE